MALRTIRVFISSPGDVAEERLIARRLIGRLDAQFGGLLQFEAIAWERAPLVATATFQDQIVRPGETDVVIVILWSRLGTALPGHIVREDGTSYASGTEYEFEDAMRAFAATGRPHIVSYMKTAPIVPSGDVASLEDAATQKRALDRFVGRWFRNEADGTLKAAFHGFATPADFEDLLEAHLTALAETFVPSGMTVRASAPTWHGRSPFRGLQVFEPEHAPVFFGRTAATASVLSKLRAQGQAGRAFVLVVSMSGAGKSSLIRAGVLPLLLQPGVVGEATCWRHAVVRPADGQGRLLPLLVQAVAAATRVDEAEDVDVLPEDHAPEALVTFVQERLRRVASIDDEGAACHLALVVDQLEEVFSDDRVVADERDAFFGALDALARSGLVWILSSMRSDAYFRIAASPTLVALKEGEGQFDLMPPTVREIGQIIRLPALAAGLRFEARPNTAERLDDVIRDAAARNPGALPLLQFLLEELYQRRSPEDVLTFRAYEDLGGVEGALAQHAEQVLAAVSAAARDAVPAALRELVTFGTDDESRALRRVAPRDAFTTPAANELIDALLEARLLVSGLGGDGTPVVSLAHEALLEFWPRMKAWVEEDRQLLLVHARLGAATREWERNARRADLLLPRGKPLAEARELVAAGIRLSEPERALLDLSQRRARRFALLRGSAIAGLAVLTVIAGVAAWRAQTESQRAQVQATTAQRTTDFMVSLFADADPFQNNGEKVTVREVLDKGVEQIDRELATEPQVRANLLRAMGEAYSGLGLLTKARSALEASASIAHVATADDRFRIDLAVANNDYLDGNYTQSETIYRAARAQAVRLHGEQSEAVALADTGLGESLVKQNRFDEAEPILQRALELNKRLNGERSREYVRDLDALGVAALSTGRFTEAEALLHRNVALRQELSGPDSAEVGIAYGNLGLLYFQWGRYALAVQTWTQVLAIEEKLLGPDHAEVGLALNNLGRVELLTNRLDAAQQHLERALRIFRQSLSNDHDDLVPPLNSLAMILLARGDVQGAAPLLDEALRIARQRQHRFLDQVLSNVAALDGDLGRTSDGIKALDEARAVQRATYGIGLDGPEAWRIAVIQLVDAQLAVQSGDFAKAHRLLSESLPLLENRFGPGSFYEAQAKQLSAKIGP